MKLILALALASLLGACQTTPVPSVVANVVETKNIQVPPVAPPSPFKPATFKFQRPEDTGAVVAFDAGNYNQFRQFMLSVNRREIEWNNRLGQANSSILLLQGGKQTATEIPSE